MKTKLLFIVNLAFASSIMFAQDPVVLNANFDKIPKISGSDCSCSGWQNKDLGDQAESSEDIEDVTGNDAIKFDNFESDLMYQEVAVTPNTDYQFTYRYRVSGDETGTSELEIRILKGSGYEDGYTPTYYATPAEAPSDGFGYSDISDVENGDNNIITVIEGFPGNDDYNIKEFSFNSGSETSIAILARGIGRPNTPNDDNDCSDAPEDITRCFTWSAGDQETRIDYIELKTQTLSVNDNVALDFRVFPNPTKGMLTIESSKAQVTSIEMFDTLGNSVLAQQNFEDSKIDASSLSTGIYLLKIDSDKGSTIRKIVIK